MEVAALRNPEGELTAAVGDAVEAAVTGKDADSGTCSSAASTATNTTGSRRCGRPTARACRSGPGDRCGQGRGGGPDRRGCGPSAPPLRSTSGSWRTCPSSSGQTARLPRHQDRGRAAPEPGGVAPRHPGGGAAAARRADPRPASRRGRCCRARHHPQGLWCLRRHRRYRGHDPHQRARLRSRQAPERGAAGRASGGGGGAAHRARHRRQGPRQDRPVDPRPVA